MKKFLVILMVVAMASFLFVGCLPAVTPDVDEDVDEDVDVGVKTDTPYITATGFSILATTTQYLTAITSVSVDGVGVAGAIIKLYIDDVYVGIGTTGTGGTFSGITVTGATVTEGAKKLCVTATVPGLAESDKSTEITFTYDTTAPSIVSVAADSTSNYIQVTFDGDVKTYTSGAKYEMSAMNPINWSYWRAADLANTTAVLVHFDSTNCTISKVSEKSIKITPTVAAEVVPTAGTAFYITMDYAGIETTYYNTVYDVAGNYNTEAITVTGTVQP